MSAAGLAGVTAGAVLAACAVMSLWWGAKRQAAQVRAAYWWLAAAAALVFVNLAIGQAALFPGSAAMLLSFADLPGFLVLLVMAAALGLLASAAPAPAAEPLPSRRTRHGLLTLGAYVVDGYLLASALFLAAWVAVLGPAFTSYDAGAASFAAELVHPLADLVLIAATLAAAGTAGRRGTMPYLALVAITVGDSLSVGARLTGAAPGVAAVAAQLLALALLALATWGWSRRPSGFPRAGGALSVTAGAAAVSAGVAAVLVTIQAVAMGRLPEPVVLIVLGVTVAALGARVVGLVRRVNSWALVWQESGRRFRQLADRTSDVVIICDLAGEVRYASRAVADYGYTPEQLTGMVLTGLLHPEDRAGAVRAARLAVSTPQRPGRYPCRIRAADGTWRHVESTLSRYHDPGGPDQLLVTARDVSAQVELRRQVTHLTYHDPLTGLPNRAFIEQRTHAVIGQPGGAGVAAGAAGPADASAGGPGGVSIGGAGGVGIGDAGGVGIGGAGGVGIGGAGGRGAGGVGMGGVGPGAGAAGEGRTALAAAIVLSVDGFAALNDAGGRGAGELLLAQLARRLKLMASPRDMVARWGGEEFAVLIEGRTAQGGEMAGYAETLEIAERLTRSVPSEPFRLGDADVTVTVSAGVAFVPRPSGQHRPGGEGGPAGQIWRNAELAMSHARELGGNRVEVYGGPPADVSQAETELLSG